MRTPILLCLVIAVHLLCGKSQNLYPKPELADEEMTLIFRQDVEKGYFSPGEWKRGDKDSPNYSNLEVLFQ